jgi:hypothetical protein
MAARAAPSRWLAGAVFGLATMLVANSILGPLVNLRTVGTSVRRRFAERRWTTTGMVPDVSRGVLRAGILAGQTVLSGPHD